MCRFFAQISTVPRSASAGLVGDCNALVEQARRHSDGWGIGVIRGDTTLIRKSSQAAFADPDFGQVSRNLRSGALIAHIRKATVGDVRERNAHPFSCGRWLFAHNGSIFGFEQLRDRVDAHTAHDLCGKIQGTTDSEAIFHYLLTALREVRQPCHGRGPVDPVIASDAIRRAIGRLFQWSEAVGLEPPKLNFVLTNGDILFAQRAGMELHLAARPGMLRISSEPTDAQPWTAIPEGHLLVADAQQVHRIVSPPDHFRVSWPAPLQPPPLRPNVKILLD